MVHILMNCPCLVALHAHQFELHACSSACLVVCRLKNSFLKDGTYQMLRVHLLGCVGQLMSNLKLCFFVLF